MIAVIQPGRTAGSPVQIPGSKSLSHRALIAAALSQGDTKICGLVENNDTKATMNCLVHLGASFEHTEDGLLIHGIGTGLSYDGSRIDCGESGSTLRFLIPLFSLTDQEVCFTGHGKLMSRPQTVYEELFRKQGLRFEQDAEFLRIRGSLRPDAFVVRGDISSQFISGLLTALPLLNGASSITVLPPYESRSYVGLTMDVLENAGIRFKETGDTILVPGNQHYHCAASLQVEGDDSQGAFFAVLAMTSQLPISVSGMRKESRQGDHVIVSLIEQAGGHSIPTDTGYRFEPGVVTAFAADLADCPDLGPVLFALAGCAEGTSVFTHCGRLRIKESDRIAAMKEELAKLGIALQEDGDTVRITGSETIRGGVTLDGHNDHRIVMALSVLAVRAENAVRITGAEAVNKSYPDFFEDLRKAGAEVSYGPE